MGDDLEQSAVGSAWMMRAVNATRRAIPNPMAGVSMHMLDRIPRVRMSNWASGLRTVFGTRPKGGAATSDDGNGASDDDDVAPPLDIVDQAFYNPAYDVVVEMKALSDNTSDEAFLAELTSIEARREQQIRAAKDALKKALLDRSEVFLKGIEQVREVDEDLKTTAEHCIAARRRLGTAKNAFVHQSMNVLQFKRRCINLQKLLRTLEALNWLRNRDLRLQDELKRGKFDAAQALCSQAEPAALSEIYYQLQGAKGLLIRAQNVISAPEQLLDGARQTLENAIANGIWHEEGIIAAMTGYSTLNKPQELYELIRELGVRKLSHQCKSILVAAAEQPVATPEGPPHPDAIPSPDWDIDRLARVMRPKELLPTLLALYRGCAETVAIFLALKETVTTASDHESALDIAKRQVEQACKHDIATEVSEIALFLLESVATPDNFVVALHCSFLTSMLLEATFKLGVGKDAMAQVRELLVAQTAKWVEALYVQSRCQQVIDNMTLGPDESFMPNGVFNVRQFQVVEPIKPDHFKQESAWAKNEVVEMSRQLSKAGRVDHEGVKAHNPFDQPRFKIMRDESTTFSSHPMPLFTLAADGRTTSHPFLDDFSPVVPATMAASSVAFELLGSVLPRAPALANRVLIWIEDVISMFVYLAGYSFAIAGSEDGIEQIVDLTPRSKEFFKVMRERVVARVGLRLPKFLDKSFVQDAFMFGMHYRVMAVAATISLCQVASCAVATCQPIIGTSVFEQHVEWVANLRHGCEELLHVTCYRLSAATFDVQDYISKVMQFRFEKAEGNGLPSPYIDNDLFRRVDLYTERRLAIEHDIPCSRGGTESVFPPQVFQCFIRHFTVVIQNATIRGLASNPMSRTMTDQGVKPSNGVTQMSIDVQTINQRLRLRFKAELPARDNHVSEFVQQAYVAVPARMAWLEAHHAVYPKLDLISFMSKDMTREQKRALENALAHHDDEEILRTFIRNRASWTAPPTSTPQASPPPAHR